MKNERLSERERRIWLMTAMVAPVVHTASGCSWLPVLLIGAVCMAICWGMDAISSGKELSEWVAWVKLLWIAPVICVIMSWSALYWQGISAQSGTAYVILAVAALAAYQGEKKSARAGNILRYFIAILIGAVLFSGLKDMRWENLRPQWQTSSADFILAFLIPSLVSAGMGVTGRIQTKLKMLAFAGVVAVIVSGVLTLRESVALRAPFYELSRSASLLGVAKRFESVTACGMTLGFYVLLSFLLNNGVGHWEARKRNRALLAVVLLAATLYTLLGEFDSRYLAMGAIITWVLLPTLDIMKNNYKKFQNSIDKDGTKW